MATSIYLKRKENYEMLFKKYEFKITDIYKEFKLLKQYEYR